MLVFCLLALDIKRTFFSSMGSKEMTEIGAGCLASNQIRISYGKSIPNISSSMNSQQRLRILSNECNVTRLEGVRNTLYLRSHWCGRQTE